MVGVLADLVRGRPARVAEHACLRQQRLVLRRSVKHPRRTPADRAVLVLLASRLRAWHQALLIVQPATLPRWHRQGFRLFWCRKRRPRSAAKPEVAAETLAPIRELAAGYCQVKSRRWAGRRERAR